MIFNCFKCGKSISSKKDVCVYCKSDTSHLAAQFNKIAPRGRISLRLGLREKSALKEKYAGTFLSFLVNGRRF